MEKSDNGSWFKEDENVDPDLVVKLLDTFRLGNANVLTREIRSKESETAPPVNTAAMEDEADNNGSQGNKPVHESTSSTSSISDPLLESTMSEIDSNIETGSNDETGSHDETGSNEEPGSDLVESNYSNLPNVENEEDSEMEKEEEEENSERSLSDSEEKSSLEKLLRIQDKYELYCPNCTSCITKNVIIMKRKLGKPIVPVCKPDTQTEIEEMEPPVKVYVPEKEHEEKRYIFTSFTCLKYFTRLGTGFLKLNYIKGKPVEPETPPQIQPEGERFAVELLKSTVYGGLTETITSLGVVSSASASGSSTENVLALAVANLAGGLIVLAQNLQDLSNNPDRYKELLGRRANFRIHILISVLSYIIFGLIPPLVYAFSFYQTGIKNYKLISVFSISLVCVILLGMIKVYVRKPRKSYLKSAAYYTSIVVASSGISFFIGDIMGEYLRKLGWFSSDQIGMSSPFYGIKPEEYRFTS